MSVRGIPSLSSSADLVSLLGPSTSNAAEVAVAVAQFLTELDIFERGQDSDWRRQCQVSETGYKSPESWLQRTGARRTVWRQACRRIRTRTCCLFWQQDRDRPVSLPGEPSRPLYQAPADK